MRKNNTSNKWHVHWRPTIGLFLTVLITFFALNGSGFFDFKKIDLVAAFPDVLGSVSLDAQKAYTLEDVNLAIGPNRRAYFTWERNENADHNVAFSRFDYAGAEDTSCLGVGDTIVSDAGSSGFVNEGDIDVNESGAFVVVWADNNPTDYDIYFSLYDSGCNPVLTEVQVNTTNDGVQISPRVSMDNTGNFVVVWDGPCDGDGDLIADDDSAICARGFNSLGVALDATEYIVNSYQTNVQYSPDIAMEPSGTGEFVVVWGGEGAEDGSGIFAKGFSNYGTPASGGDQIVNITTNGSQQNPRIAVNQGNSTIRYVIVWDGEGASDTDGIYARRVTGCLPASCPFSNTELLVNTNTIGVQSQADVAMDYDGNSFVVWNDRDIEIHGQMLAFSGDAIGVEQTILVQSSLGATALKTPVVAMAPDGYMLVAADVCIDAVCASATDKRWAVQEYKGSLYQTGDGSLDPSNLVTNQSGGVVSGDIAVDPLTGNYVVVWNGQGQDAGGTSDTDGVWFTLKDKDDNVISSQQNVLVNTLVAGSQSAPKVAFFENGSSFVVCYEGEGDTDGDTVSDYSGGVFYRRFDSAGVALDTNEVLAHASDSGIVATDCDVAGGTGGSFILGYVDDTTKAVTLLRQPTYAASPFAYSPNTPTGTVTQYALDMNANNDFVMVAHFDYSAQADSDIVSYKGTFDDGIDFIADSVVIGNTGSFTVDASKNLDIALDEDGNIVVLASGNTADDVDGVYAISYNLNAAGEAISTLDDSAVLINQSTAGDEGTVSLAADGNGNYVATWLTDIGALPITPFARWFSLEANNVFVMQGPEFVLDEYHLAILANNLSGPAAAPAGLYEDGELKILVRSKDSSGFNWYGDDRQLRIGDEPILSSTVEQEVLSGGRTVVLPEAIQFPSVSASAQSSVTNTVAFEDNTASATKYVEVQDLFADGNAYSVTMSISTSFTFEGTAASCTNNVNCIPDSNVEIRNYDQDGDLTTAVFGSSGAVSLDSSTDDFVTLDSQRTLLTGLGDEIGRWRFYPELRITIPAKVPPGQHTAVLTFTLN